MTSFVTLLAAHATGTLAFGGLLIGIVFGWTVYRTNFCVMGALSDVYNFGDARRLKAWLLAIIVALVATQALRVFGVVPLERAIYVTAQFNWLGHALGGAIFGFGMVLTGGCPTRNVVRFGSGDLRAMVVLLVVAITGLVTLGGLLGPVRDVMEQLTTIDLRRFGLTSQSAGAVLSLTGLADPARLDLLLALALGIIGALYLYRDRAFTSSRAHVASGLVVGLLVASGWALTGLAYDEFAPQTLTPVSLTFIKPLGDTLDWLQRFTAIPWPGFGTASVAGTLLGAFAAARTSGRFRVLGFADIGDMKTNLTGAAMMGVGGAMALGCTVGQGITGLSTLALGSMLTTAALVGGGVYGLRYLERTLDA